jgi:hypothetical protein
MAVRGARVGAAGTDVLASSQSRRVRHNRAGQVAFAAAGRNVSTSLRTECLKLGFKELGKVSSLGASAG